jgi:cbb3-type cytochrome oxidase subunit 3
MPIIFGIQSEWLIIIFLIIVIIIMALQKRNKGIDNNAETNEEKDDEIEYAEVVEMGKCDVYPVCPGCQKEIKKILMIWNNGKSKDYDSRRLNVRMCGNCHYPISCVHEDW